MTYKLYAYNSIIDTGITILGFWDTSTLSGNDPFVLSTSPVAGYTDVTSLVNLKSYSHFVLSDYQEQRNAIKALSYEIGWDNLTSAEKEIVLEYWANPDLGDGIANTQMVTYMITSGQAADPNEASDLLVDKWYEHWHNYVQDCPLRLKNAIKVLLHYINFSDANDIDNDIHTLKQIYLTSGRLGVYYGDSTDGIMDWINSTGGFVGAGLEENGYVLKKGTYSELKDLLEKELVSRYFWNDIASYFPTGYPFIN